jgi:hypothetical protein
LLELLLREAVSPSATAAGGEAGKEQRQPERAPH